MIVTERERMQELIDILCDADARARRSEEELETYSPTLIEVLDVMGDVAS